MNQPLPAFLTTKEEALGNAFLVAGMHRSGTSALARVLSLLGAELPRTLMVPGFDNPKGFWESIPIAELNENLLAEFGSGWDDVLAFLARRERLARDPKMVARVRGVFEQEYERRGDIVVKDPRIALLMDLWMSAVSGERLAPRVIIPLRDPLEIAASLNARDGIATGNSIATGNALLLWLGYFLASERSSRGAPRVFTQYTDLLTDWRGVLRRLEKTLGVTFTNWSPALELEIDAYISTTDRHQVMPIDLINERPDVADWVKRAYAWGREAASGVEPASAELDKIAAEFEASLTVFSPIIAQHRRELQIARRERVDYTAHKQIEAELREARASIAALSLQAAAKEELEAKLNVATKSAAELRAGHAMHAAQLEGRVGHLEAEIARRDAAEIERVAVSEARAKERQARVDGLVRDLNAMSAELDAQAAAAQAAQRESDQAWQARLDAALAEAETKRRQTVEHMQQALAAARSQSDAAARQMAQESKARIEQAELSLARVRSEGATAVARANAQAAILVAEARAESEAQVAAARAEAEAALAKMRHEADAALKALQDEQTRLLSAASQRARGDQRALVQQYEERFGAARAEHQADLAALEKKLAGEIAGVRASAAQALDEQISEHGGAVLAAARALREAKQGEFANRRQQFARHPTAQKRAAGLFRPRVLRPLLRATWPTRAATLLGSGLYVPVDGPGGKGIVEYARRTARAPAPHPLFDEEYYWRNEPIAAERELGALHYLWRGDKERRDPHPLFSIEWYCTNYDDKLQSWRLTTLEHFLARGAREWCLPHPLFDTVYYVPQAPDVYERGVNPLVHYLRSGWREGLDPHPLFRTSYYLEKNPDVRDAGMNPLIHYVTNGWRENRDPHPLFSSQGYLDANPDVAAHGINPLVHYLTNGWRENRKPSPHFDPQLYLQANEDVAESGAEPLTHYLINGAWEGRQGAESFDVQRFCGDYPYDVLSGATPLESWVRIGAPELKSEVTAQSASVGALASFGAADVDETLFDHITGRSQELQDNYDWPAYERLSTAMRAEERRRIEELKLTPPKLIKIDERNLRAAAEKLSFRTDQGALEVSIVIPVYNQVKYTLECLSSLAATIGGARAEIVVIDDGSSDETGTLIGAIPGVRYIRNEENLGFLKTVNRACTMARGKKLIILNNDTQVLGDWLRQLLGALDDESVGIAAPKLLFPDGRLQEAGAAIKSNGTADLIGLFDDPKLDRFCYDRDVDYVSGACIAIRRADFEALGGFDEYYAPAYCEDCDLCLKVRQKGKRIRYVAGAEVCHHLSITSNAQPGSYKMQQARRNQQKLLDRWNEEIAELNKVRVISFYLPQFHTIPENDQWWGAGFTEWRNVTRAVPNFVGHYQPHRPSELGFYDVMRAEVMERQAELARAYGVHGFCYYYYWFSGRRVLEAPLERLLTTGKPDLPFCICWANENWTRTWDGQEKNVLLEQRYSDSDDDAVIADMMRYFRSPNYIRINGKPLLVIYRTGLFPDFKRTAERWRRACRIAGIGEIYIAMVEQFEHALTYPSPRAWGCDASIEFPPAGMSEPIAVGRKLNPRYTGVVSDYSRIVRRYMREPAAGHTRFRTVMPSWDNTARRQDNAYIFQGATPGAFQAWLEAVIEQTRLQNFGDERIVFVNAWNEWAEGAHLEPDLRFGRGWLEAVRNAQAAEQQLYRSPQP